MRLFGLNFGLGAGDARAHHVEAGRPRKNYDKPQLKARGLRRGMWVMRAGWPRAAILTGLNADGIATVMMVQEDGTNLAESHVPVTAIRQAAYSEIPVTRREGRSAEEFEAMGYRRRP